MVWGTFGFCHIASLLLGAGIIVGLYFLLRNKSTRVKTAVLGVLSFSGIAAIIFNLVTWGSPIEYLPFHLCSLNALVLPLAVFTKNKVLNNLLLLWSIGAFFALVVNFAQANFEIFSLTFVFYFFPHVLELGIPILMFALKLTKKELKYIFSTVGITFSVYTVVHMINRAINSYTQKNGVLDSAGNIIEVNYMYSIKPANPLLDLFYKIIPYQYWYMYLSIIVIAVFLSLVYLNNIISLIKSASKR